MINHKESYPCGLCSQEDSCECFGEPVAALTIQGYEVQSFSSSCCFFYVCEEGKLAALNAYRVARGSKQEGLTPFGTGHKPHCITSPHGLDVKGRFVARNHESWADYDVIAVVNGQEKRLTNVR